MRKRQKKAKKIYYVFRFALLWAVKKDGMNKALEFCSDKRDAIAFATDIAKKREAKLIIYDRKGQIIKTVNYAKKGRPATKRKLVSRKKV